ncbi:hypothetical protein KCP73_22395 [Salmonella enterica subsp. enterica]|nr:hypothetical protein KCP73_22395 [Salmonella enterica subsp. enterica]
MTRICIFMLENQHTIGNAQATNIKRPAAIFRYVSKEVLSFGATGASSPALPFAASGEYAPFSITCNMKLMTQQRHKATSGAYCQPAPAVRAGASRR